MHPKCNTHTIDLFAHLTTSAVALEFGIPTTAIRSRTKGSSQASLARQICMYLLNVVFEVNVSRVARAYQRDRSTASHACHVVEDLRDDPVLNQKISKLEAFLSSAPRGPHMSEMET